MKRLTIAAVLVSVFGVGSWAQTTSDITPSSGQVSSPEIKSEHAKLFSNHPPGRDILQETQAGKDVSLMVQVISDWVDNSEAEQKLPSYPDHNLVGLACGADAIVNGSPVAVETSLTEKGDFLFTDYRIHVESVAKGSTVQSNSEIIVTRPGGRTRINNHLVNMQIDGFPLFSLNSRYLLFLRYLPETKTYQAFKTGTFLLGDTAIDSVNATDPGTAETVKHTEHQDAFMAELRAAITAPCSGVSQRLE